MPHQCVRCNKTHPDGSKVILAGCECGGKFFFYVRKKDLSNAKKVTENLTPEEKTQIMEDVSSIVGTESESAPVVLDFESIRISKPGKYELDLVDLFRNKPLVYKVEDGKYIIDIASTFDQEDED